ncbi:putative ankyrin repeat-containing domain-containing protein [Helianthus debilis subsp. tardiflorus]
MNLERYSITENGETALHVAASAKNPKDVEKFVKNLVGMMQDEDLELQNENHNTALYLAAVAGNIEAVKIMFERNKALLSIAGANGAMMPLYAAVLFRNEDVVKYMYNNSNNLGDKGWTPQKRGWLLEKCVEMDMFGNVELVLHYTYIYV